MDVVVQDKPFSTLGTSMFKVDEVSMAFFRASTIISLGDGNTIRFWMDSWLHGRMITEVALNLFEAVARRRRETRTVASALQDHNWIRDITGPCMIPVIMQYLALRQEIQSIVLAPGTPVRFIWRWCLSGVYSTSSAYQALFLGQSVLHMIGASWSFGRQSACNAMVEEPWPLCSLFPGVCVHPDHLLLCCVYSLEVWLRCCDGVVDSSLH
jgi:hypothetical protein